jgi:hypothetical protein
VSGAVDREGWAGLAGRGGLLGGRCYSHYGALLALLGMTEGVTGRWPAPLRRREGWQPAQDRWRRLLGTRPVTCSRERLFLRSFPAPRASLVLS